MYSLARVAAHVRRRTLADLVYGDPNDNDDNDETDLNDDDDDDNDNDNDDDEEDGATTTKPRRGLVRDDALMGGDSRALNLLDDDDDDDGDDDGDNNVGTKSTRNLDVDDDGNRMFKVKQRSSSEG